MKLTDSQLMREVLLSRPLDLPAFFARRLIEATRVAPKGEARSRFGDVIYPVDMSLHAMARKYHFHTHEMFLEKAFRRALKPGDVFVDIGANLGYWSAFSAQLVGPGGEVHAFEPVPEFHASLDRFARANPSHRIFANQCALGAGDADMSMAVVDPKPENYENFNTNIGASSLLPGFLDHAAALTRDIQVAVTSLDNYLAAQNIDLERIGLIKIDVEGFESYCLDGMKTVLEKTGRKIPILCEILTDPLRNPLLDGRATIERLRAHGYVCLHATTFKPIDPENLQFEENIYCV